MSFNNFWKIGLIFLWKWFIIGHEYHIYFLNFSINVSDLCIGDALFAMAPHTLNGDAILNAILWHIPLIL